MIIFVALGFQVWGILFNDHVFFQKNLLVLVIHDLVVQFVCGGKLSENRDHEQPMSSLWDSMEFLRFFPAMQFIFPRSVRARICLLPCVS